MFSRLILAGMVSIGVLAFVACGSEDDGKRRSQDQLVDDPQNEPAPEPTPEPQPDPEPSPDPEQPLDFATDIKPITEANCLPCHGGGGRLNPYAVEEAALQENKVAVALRLTTDDLQIRMPPARTGKTLTEEQLTKILRFLEQ